MFPISFGRLSVIIAALLAVNLGLAACKGQPTPEPTPLPEAPAVSALPKLFAKGDGVQFRQHETDPLTTVASGSDMDVEPGGNIVVGKGGPAHLVWTDFLTHELLADTDTLLSLSVPEERNAILDQATGTGRYRLGGAGEPADLEVKAGAIIDLRVTAGEADFIVSLIPGVEPAAWLVVSKGEVTVTKADAPAAAGADAATTPSDADAPSVIVRAGEAAGFTKAAELPQPLAVDASAVEAWYQSAAAGTATDGVTSVAFRCQVIAEGKQLLAGPSASGKPLGEVLAKGTLLTMSGRSADDSYLMGQPLTAVEKGWIAAEHVACLGPVANLAPSGPGVAAGPTPTLPLARPTRPLTTRTATAPANVTATTTPTAMVPEIDFRLTKSEIDAGDCATVKWDVSGVREVYLNGEGVAGKGEMKVCPDEDTSYTLKVVTSNGEVREDSLTLHVRQKENTAVPPATSPPADTPEPGPTDAQPTPEPPFATEPPPAPTP